jgi:hypothetical protein
MDPDTALREMRQRASDILTFTKDSDARLLAESFEALDSWLAKGGFLPQDWKTNDRARRDA